MRVLEDRSLRFAFVAGVSAIILLVDARLRLGISTATLYAPLLLLCAGEARGRVLGVAAVCTALTYAGYALSPSGTVEAAWVNRLISVLVIWAVALSVSRHAELRRRNGVREEALRNAVAKLEEHEVLLVERERDRVKRARVMASVLDDLNWERKKLREQVAKRTRAERERGQLAAIIDASDDAIVGKDLQGTISSWNSGAERLYGYSSEAAVGQPTGFLAPEGTADQIPELLDRIRAGESVEPFESRRRRADGTEIDVAIVVSPVRDEWGNLVGFSTIARDITQRKRADLLVKLAFEAAPSGMLLVDRHGSIVMVNSKIDALFGYERESLIGLPIETLVPHRFRESHPENFARYLRSPQERDIGKGGQFIGLTRDGVELPLEIGMTIVDTGEGVHVLAAVVDITERKKMISEIRAKTTEMEQLLYVVSHDLKSPLVTVEGFSALMVQALETGKTEQAIEAAHRVQRGAKTMGRLIEDLLSLSRVSSHELSPEDLDMTALLDEVLGSLAGPLEAARARVEIVQPLPGMYADYSQLVQVLLNLLSNAIKYGCEEPGATIYVGGTGEALETILYVRDEGPGIDECHHERVFDLFQRLSSDNQGTGLGLATVAKVVDRHHGRVWVESKPDEGATFWIALPRRNTVRSPRPRVAA